MHRFSGIFVLKKRVDSKQKRASSSVKPKPKPKPRLERLNARRNIDYEPSFPEFSGDKSFRIEGSDGEILDFIEKFGFSGIDDFAIPPDEYEAMKVRSSSDNLIDVTSNSISVIDKIKPTSDVIQLQLHSAKLNDLISEVSIADLRLEDGPRPNKVVSKRPGIKGARPPLLAPPPGMSLPIVDGSCSTWDIFRAFGPEVDHRIMADGACTSEVVVNGGAEFIKNEEDGEESNTRRRILSESCSFTTASNDDDSSSSTTERMSIISPNGRFTRFITGWDKGILLGRGTFGSVYEGIAADGFFFAVKEVSLLDQDDGGRQSVYQLEQEIELLSQFEHENIVQYYGTDKDDSKLYIFLELITQGSLLKLYQKYHLRDSQVSAYTRQILHGLKYLHDQNVVHRDIKCANILVDANGSVKLADFGLAKATKLNDVKSCKGTALWMAPEVVNNKNQGYGLAADIWSLGCTVLEMLTRQFPYSHLENQMQALFQIGKGEPPPVPDTLSIDARDFICQCLQVDPSARPTASQLLDHSFLRRSSGSASPHSLGKRL